MVSSYIRVALAINFALAVSGMVIPRLAPGTQFITGPCTADADCASTCCGAKTGVCNALAVANGPGGGGCGGSAGAAAAPPAAAAAASTGSGKPPGTQFITGPCSADADCASTCCGAKTGVCNALAVANGPGGGGCGGKAGGSGKPPGTQFITGPCSADADCASTCCGAKTGVCNALAVANGPGGGGCGGKAGVSAAPAPAAAAPPAAAPVSAGTQFITGPCSTNGDCASGCCGKNSGLCAARAVALETVGCRD
ncbi:hypothetical protein C8R46DRAFT_105532 [Mycena filopes]|nr:hypothetical protein C8R46DRAFT_105532 [Mycena filopes]